MKGITLETLPQAVEQLFVEIKELREEIKKSREKKTANVQTRINLEEAAELLGKAVSTVRTLAQRGKVPSYKVGKSRVFVKEELTEWMLSKPSENIANHEVIPIPEPEPRKSRPLKDRLAPRTRTSKVGRPSRPVNI